MYRPDDTHQGPEQQTLDRVLATSYLHGFQGAAQTLTQELDATAYEVASALGALVRAGHMRWVSAEDAEMTVRGIERAERLRLIAPRLIDLRQRAAQALAAEAQARGGEDDAPRHVWAERLRRDADLRDMLAALKTVLT